MPNHQYDDISDLPRPVSRRHRPMPIEERAVQFAPFAALACYEEILMEVARSTQECPQLSEDEQTRLDALLQQLRGRQPPALLLSEGEEIPLERMLALELIENPG